MWLPVLVTSHLKCTIFKRSQTQEVKFIIEDKVGKSSLNFTQVDKKCQFFKTFLKKNG